MAQQPQHVGCGGPPYRAEARQVAQGVAGESALLQQADHRGPGVPADLAEQRDRAGFDRPPDPPVERGQLEQRLVDLLAVAADELQQPGPDARRQPGVAAVTVAVQRPPSDDHQPEQRHRAGQQGQREGDELGGAQARALASTECTRSASTLGLKGLTM
nr:hypothetical protein GCM10020093_118190 [Planobispora longispora]BFE89456.1 hypothetical protein GCM10020093_120580 [Planobispora longispora]